MLEKEQLEVGGIYRLRARNLLCGAWTGVTFVGIRYKFGSSFLDEAEVPFATAFPEEKLGEVPDNVSLTAYLPVEDDDGDSYVSLMENPALREVLNPYQAAEEARDV
jgi:hypothetical protein